MSEYFFGLGSGWLSKKAAAIAEQHGATLINHTDAGCSCGYGCRPHSCNRSRRHWFATDNRGEPFDSETAKEVLNALHAAGIKGVN